MQEQTLLVVACSALDTESMGAASAEKASSALAELDITNEKRHEPFPLTPAPSVETEDVCHLSPRSKLALSDRPEMFSHASLPHSDRPHLINYLTVSSPCGRSYKMC